MNLEIPSKLSQLIAIDADVARLLIPPAVTAAKRADAGAEAVRLVDQLYRALLSAGLCTDRQDPIGRAVLDLQEIIRSEAAALRSWATVPGCDDEEPAPADAY